MGDTGPMTETPQLEPVAAERLSHVKALFTSDLSVNEFALLHGAGFDPMDLVMGVSVYHVGFQNSGMRQQQELGVLTEAMYRARWNAMSRMQAEADSLGADGIVGVKLEWRGHGEAREHIEFVAVGTAVRYTAEPGAYRRPNGTAFSSHLSGQDLVTLLATGHAPVALVMGNCVYHVAAQGFMQTLKQIGRNIEMPQWTQGNYEARELAMSRMQAEASRDGAAGVVGVRFTVHNYVWGVHTLEFYADGTAIRPLGDATTIKPSFTLPMS
jgi:uncharacterized protein YbjQ (UPF0145 family)